MTTTPSIGGTGNDTLLGGGGTDSGDYGATTTAVAASLMTATVTGGAGSDTLSGIENLDRGTLARIRSTATRDRTS